MKHNDNKNNNNTTYPAKNKPYRLCTTNVSRRSRFRTRNHNINNGKPHTYNNNCEKPSKSLIN